MPSFRNASFAFVAISVLAGCETVERRCDEPINNQTYRQGGECCSSLPGSPCRRDDRDRNKDPGSIRDANLDV